MLCLPDSAYVGGSAMICSMDGGHAFDGQHGFERVHLFRQHHGYVSGPPAHEQRAARQRRGHLRGCGPRPDSAQPAGAAGDRNIKVANAAGFSPGSLVIIGVEVRTVAATGTAGRILSLAAPAAESATNLKIANLRGGFGGGPVDIGAQVVIAGSPQVYTIIGPKDASGAFSGTQGADGTGIILSAPIASALPRNAPVRYLGTGLTLARASRGETRRRRGRTRIGNRLDPR